MLRRMTFYLYMFILVALLSLFAASAHAAADAKDAVVIGLKDDIASLDPAKSYEGTAWGLMNYIYERLVNFQNNDFTQPVPELAESWELGDDGKTWTFRLRPGVFFASGNPVDADAVVFSLRRAITLAHPPSWLLLQFGLTEESIVKIDEQTVQIVLDQQYAPGVFLSCLTLPIASILDPAVMEHEQDGDMGSAWLDGHSAGSGPFVLKERRPGHSSEYILKAREQYWREKPLVQQMIVRGVSTADQQMFLLDQGEIDIAWNLESTQIQELAMNPDVQTFEALTLIIRYLTMNLGYEPLAKPEVRDAIRYAIDYDGLINTVLQGAALKIQTFIPKGLLGYNPDTPYSHDLVKARVLMREAGYPDGFEVELMCLDFSPWLEIAAKIKADLATIGITVKMLPRPVEEFVEVEMSRKTQMFMWEWGTDYLDPDSNAKGFAHSNSPGEDASIQALAWWVNYVNVETSNLVDQAMRELDSGKRQALYGKITETILDDGPFAILCTPMYQYAVRAEVVDVLRPSSVSWLPFPTLK